MIPDNGSKIIFDPPANYSVSKKDDFPAAITGLILAVALYLQYWISGSISPLNLLIIAVLMLMRLRAKDFWIKYERNVWMIKRPMKKPVVFLNRDITNIDIQKSFFGKTLIIHWERSGVKKDISFRNTAFDMLTLLNDFQKLYPDKITDRVRQEIAHRALVINQSVDYWTTILASIYALFFLYSASQANAEYYSFRLFHFLVLFAPVIVPFSLVATLYFRYRRVRWARTTEAWNNLIAGIAVFVLLQNLGTRFLQVSAYGEFFSGLLALSVIMAALALRSALSNGYTGTAIFLLIIALVPGLIREKTADSGYLKPVQEIKSEGKYISRWGIEEDYCWNVEKVENKTRGNIFSLNGKILGSVELPGYTTLGSLEFDANSFIYAIDKKRWLAGTRDKISMYYTDTTMISQILWQSDQSKINNTPYVSPSKKYLTWNTGTEIFLSRIDEVSRAVEVTNKLQPYDLGFDDNERLIYTEINKPCFSPYTYSLYVFDGQQDTSKHLRFTDTNYMTLSRNNGDSYLWGIDSKGYWVSSEIDNEEETPIVSSNQIPGFESIKVKHLDKAKTLLFFQNEKLIDESKPGVILALWQSNSLQWLPDTLAGKIISSAGDSLVCSILLQNEGMFDFRHIYFTEESDSLNRKAWRTPSILSALSSRRFEREIRPFSADGKKIFWPYDWQKLISKDKTMKVWEYQNSLNTSNELK